MTPLTNDIEQDTHVPGCGREGSVGAVQGAQHVHDHNPAQHDSGPGRILPRRFLRQQRGCEYPSRLPMALSYCFHLMLYFCGRRYTGLFVYL